MSTNTNTDGASTAGSSVPNSPERIAPKRTRPQPTPNDSNAAEQFIRRSELDDLLDSFNENVASTIIAQNSTLAQSIRADTGNLIRAYDVGAQRQFSDITATLTLVQESLNSHDTRFSDLTTQIEELRAGLHIAETTSPNAAQSLINHQTFARDPNPSTIRVGAAELITREAILLAIAPWLGEANLSSADFTLNGPPIGKSFNLSFHGPTGLGALRATKALQLLKGADGTWREIHAISPTTAAIKLFLSPDKSPKQTRIEAASRKLFKIIQELHPTKTVNLLRREGVVSVDWKPLVKVGVENADSPTTLLWNAKVLQDLGLDKSPIHDRFNLDTGSTSNIMWAI
jgi:hypothetical protein